MALRGGRAGCVYRRGGLLIDHGPWNKPRVETAKVHNYATTGEAARAAGATVIQTTLDVDRKSGRHLSEC